MSPRKKSIFTGSSDGFGETDQVSAAGHDFVIVSRQPVDTIPSSGPLHIPILPLKDAVVFPETAMPLAVGQPRSVQLIEDVLRGDKQVGLVTAKSPDIEVPGPEDIFRVGVLASVQRMIDVG